MFQIIDSIVINIIIMIVIMIVIIIMIYNYKPIIKKSKVSARAQFGK